MGAKEVMLPLAIAMLHSGPIRLVPLTSLCRIATPLGVSPAQSRKDAALTSTLFLDFNLAWLLNDDFRDALVILYEASHAHLFVCVLGFRLAKFGSVTSPNQNRENLPWVWLIELQKGWTPLGSGCVMRAENVAANGSPFSNVALCFSRR